MTVYKGIDHVQLAAPKGCEEQAKMFYGDLLKMEEIPKPTVLQARGGVWFKCGSHQVHIGVQEDFVPSKKGHPAFELHDLKKFRQALLDSGIEVKDDDNLEGAIRFYLNDPFGNRLEFLEWIKG